MKRLRSSVRSEPAKLNRVHLSEVCSPFGDYAVYCDDTRKLLGYTNDKRTIERDPSGAFIIDSQQPIIDPTTVQLIPG